MSLIKTVELPSFALVWTTLHDLGLKWLASYLADRRQSARIRSAVSVDSQLCFGVPQGSVLGPVLFSMYVAPVEDIVLSHGLRPMFYADDSHLPHNAAWK